MIKPLLLFNMMLLTFPVKVEAGMLWADDPLKVTLADALLASIFPEVRFMLPFNVSVFAPIANVPAVKVIPPATDNAVPMTNVLLDEPVWFNVKLPMVFNPVVKSNVPKFPFPVLSIVKSVAEVVETVPVVIINAELIAALLNN